MDAVEILVGVALAGIGWLLRVAVKLERRLDGMPEGQRLTSQLADLHAWHRPDQAGRQSWKDQGPVLDRLDTLNERLGRLIVLLEQQASRGERA